MRTRGVYCLCRRHASLLISVLAMLGTRRLDLRDKPPALSWRTNVREVTCSSLLKLSSIADISALITFFPACDKHT